MWGALSFFFDGGGLFFQIALSALLFLRETFSTNFTLKTMTYKKLVLFPPGSKSVALQLVVHLILLYFIRIWSWVRRLFFYFGGWSVVGGLPLLDSSHYLILIWYIYFRCICIYLAIVIIFAKILVDLILSSSWTFFKLFSKSRY